MSDAPSLVPPIRPDLRVEEAPAGGAHLFDPVRDRRIRLDARGLQLVGLMDRAQSPEVLLERIAATGRPMAPEALARVLDAFDSLGLLASEDRPDPEAPPEIDPATVPLLIDPALRFTCASCGSCCCGVNIPFDRVTLEQLDESRQEVLKRELGLEGPPVVVIQDGDDHSALPLCRTRNGGCVFLEGRLCGLHRRWGAESKPLVCRAFPLELLRTPRGISVGLQMECRDLMRTSQGQPLTQQEPEIRRILAQAGSLSMARDQVSLDGATFLSFDEYLALEDEVVAAIEACPGGGFECLAAAGHVLSMRCAATGRPLPVPEDTPEALRDALLDLLEEVGRRLAALRRRLREEGAGLLVRTVTADAVHESLTDLPPWLDRSMASDEEGEARSFARMVARNVWRGREVLRPSDLVTAHSMAVLRWLLARAGALSTANREIGRAHV